MNNPLRVGILGCGNISPAYFKGCAIYGRAIRAAACADLNPEAAAARGAEQGVPVLGVEEMLASSEIDLVVNLTVPGAHAEMNRRILEAGKHAYCEKPFALDLTEGIGVLRTATAKGLRVGCAPDTVLGAGIQTARRLLDEGMIGRPVGACAFMMGRGPEHWHPNPAFFFRRGGGPLLDMGPYYFSALVTLLGPATTVTALVRSGMSERPSLHGGLLPVETPTHLAGLVDFASGVTATTTFSFDAFGGSNLPRIEIYGLEGSLSMPDPNGFGGPVSIRRKDSKEWEEVALTHEYPGQRGLGVADLAEAVGNNRPHRASGELAQHVLEILLAFERAAEARAHYPLTTTCARPEPMPPTLAWVDAEATLAG